ncbi:uncharacterized protein LOC131874000 [Cryptomeria japonica]|uniref:uncharacterized protein LOC131874000 n=1 Tax=Cryptomeria japonica TaxID=3369 RepID=UPI0027DA8FD8|nr:uncharacterized protein LOC131874000 [Cryptomeria japonica]
MEKELNEFWDEYQRNMDNMVSHTRIQDRLNMLLQDASTREKVKKKVHRLLVTHEEFTKALKSEFDECQQTVRHGVPSLVDDACVIKDKTVWISECKEEDSSSAGKSENREENPFHKINSKDNRCSHDEIMNAQEHEEKHWDDLILKIADMSVDDAKMARALKRQLDWVLQKLGIERSSISSPKTNKSGEERGETSRQVVPKYSPHMRRNDQPFLTYDNLLVSENRRWRDVHRDQNEERLEDGRRNGDGENYGNRINTNRANHVGNNGCGNNQNNGQNRGNNGNYGSGNGGCRNNGNNNGNNNGGGNNGNNGNYGNNNGIMNNQSNHHVGRQPLIIERYKQLDFTGIVGYPNQITNDLRLSIPKFSRNGVESVEQHVINVKNIIEEFEIPHEDQNHYEILSHRPNTLQQAFKTIVTIENNRRVAGKVAKRDDPKLYNSSVPRKDYLT